jgi:hypothetical protein
MESELKEKYLTMSIAIIVNKNEDTFVFDSGHKKVLSLNQNNIINNKNKIENIESNEQVIYLMSVTYIDLYNTYGKNMHRIVTSNESGITKDSKIKKFYAEFPMINMGKFNLP